MTGTDIITQAAAVTDLALRASGTQADKLLMEIAEEGDANALEVARLLPPSAKSSIIRNHDFTVPSYFGLLAKPEDVISIMVGDPKTWLNVETMSAEDVISFIEDIRTFVTSLILSNGDDVWQEEVFAEIAASEEAKFFLAVAFSGRVSTDGYNFSYQFERCDSGDGTISHLYRVMNACDEDLAQHIASIICLKEDWNYGDAMNSISNTIEIMAEIQTRTKKESLNETSLASDMMEDL